MNASILGLGGLLWARHRRGLIAVAAAWLFATAAALMLPAEPGSRLALLCCQLALPISLVYLVTVFAFGFDGIPLESRDSCFPTRQFTLPVRTWALVGWPMISGTLAVALAWWAWVGLVLRPIGVEELPLVWPGFFLASAMAWLQALLWTPFGWPYVRVAAAMIAAGVFIAMMAIGIILKVPEPLLCGLYMAMLIPASLLAYRGVSRGRHGDTPDWGWPTLTTARIAPVPVRQPFRDADAAQFWLESRNTNVAFLVMLFWFLGAVTLSNWLLLLPTEYGFPAGERLAALFPFTRETTLTLMMFSPLATMPIFLGASLGIDMGKIGMPGQPSTFLLTRPLTASAMIYPKLKFAALNVLAGGVLMCLAAGLWFLLPGVATVVREWWRQVLEMYHPVRAWAMVLMAAVAVLGMTWLQMCQGFVFGIIGRLWARVVPVIVVGGLVIGAVVAQWVWTEWSEAAWLKDVVPALLMGAVVVKLLTLAWTLHQVVTHRLWPPRMLLLVIGVWVLTAGSLFVLLSAVVPTESVSVFQQALGVVAATPLTRILAAPVVLDRVRHG